jgi:hypothetical protein
LCRVLLYGGVSYRFSRDIVHFVSRVFFAD